MPISARRRRLKYSTPPSVTIKPSADGALGFGLAERPIDGRTPNSKCLCDGRRTHTLLLERPHLCSIHAWFPPLVDAGRLCLSDAFQLTFFAKVGLELGEHPQHVEESLARGSPGIYRL